MIRPSTAKDRGAIRDLLDAAFAPSRFESRLRQLVAGGSGDSWEWVVERDARIVGHILYTPARRGLEVIGFHLAPVAIHPDFQGQGIGTRLIRATLAREPLQSGSVFVLGDPCFYERFGFNACPSARCPFDDGNAHFRALRWEEEDVGEPFEIGYSPPFHHAARRTDPSHARA